MKIKCLICNDILNSTNSDGLIKCKCGACYIDNIGNNITRIGGDYSKIVAIKDDGTRREIIFKII